MTPLNENHLSKIFQKNLEKLPPKLRKKVEKAVLVFRKNPFESSLRNHALKGCMLGKRAFSVTGDIRIIFEEHENYTLVLMLDVGTHNQVY